MNECTTLTTVGCERIDAYVRMGVYVRMSACVRTSAYKESYYQKQICTKSIFKNKSISSKIKDHLYCTTWIEEM